MSDNHKFKQRLFEILEDSTDDDFATRIFGIFIISLILLNVIAIMLETVDNFLIHYQSFFEEFERFSVFVFSVEYLLRLWSCTSDNRYKSPFAGRIHFAFTPLSIIDLIAVLPFYLPLFLPVDLDFLRAVRLLRLFKMGRYSKSLRTFSIVMNTKKEELFIALFIILILLMISSSLMYFAEHEAQPDVFSSIPASMW